MYKKNEKYFDSIDNLTKAYWLGFLFADGYNSNKSIILDLSGKDYYHLFKFSNIIFGKDLVKNYERKGNKFSKLEIHSKWMCKKLSELGCIKGKTKKLKFPNIDKKYYNHFIRGYFDGDGCVHKVKVKKRSNYVKFTSCNVFIDELLEILKFAIGDCFYFIEQESEEIKSLKVIGNPSILKIYFYLYNNCEDFMERKKQTFEDIKNQIDENIEKTIRGTRGYSKKYLEKYKWYIEGNYNV